MKEDDRNELLYEKWVIWKRHKMLNKYTIFYFIFLNM